MWCFCFVQNRLFRGVFWFLRKNQCLYLAPFCLMFVIYDIMKISRKRLTHWLTESVNDEAVFRAAPATPGLLKTQQKRMVAPCCDSCCGVCGPTETKTPYHMSCMATWPWLWYQLLWKENQAAGGLCEGWSC